MSITIYNPGDKAEAAKHMANWAWNTKLSNERAIANGAVELDSGSQKMIDIFSDSEGANGTVDTGNTDTQFAGAPLGSESISGFIEGSGASLAKIDETHFIVAYRGTDNDGFVSTVSINSDNTYTIEDTYEFDTNIANSISCVLIDPTHFAISYRGGGDNDNIEMNTFSFDVSYTITKEDSLIIATSSYDTSSQSLILLDSTHLVCCFEDDNHSGQVCTISFDGNYDLTKIDTHQFQGTTHGAYTSICKIDDTHFAIASYQFIYTLSVNGSYIISGIDSMNMALSYASLQLIDATHLLLAYGGNGDDGYIRTITLDGSYNMTTTDILEHDTTLGQYNILIKLNTTEYLLLYHGIDGNLKRFSIDINYNITQENVFSIGTNLTGSSSFIISMNSLYITILTTNGILQLWWAKDPDNYMICSPSSGVDLTDSTLQSNSFTIPTDATKIFVTNYLAEELETGDSVTFDVSTDNGGNYLTDQTVNTWVDISSLTNTGTAVVKLNLKTHDGSTTPKVKGWCVLVD